MRGKAQNPSHENKEAVLASTFSSPPMGRDENVLKCFLLTEFNNNFESYQKRSLKDVVALGNCNWGWLGFIGCIPMSFQRDICSTYTSRARSNLIQNIISQRQVTIERRSEAHFSRVFKYFWHASTCNPSCVELSYLWEGWSWNFVEKRKFWKFSKSHNFLMGKLEHTICGQWIN